MLDREARGSAYWAAFFLVCVLWGFGYLLRAVAGIAGQVGSVPENDILHGFVGRRRWVAGCSIWVGVGRRDCCSWSWT